MEFSDLLIVVYILLIAFAVYNNRFIKSSILSKNEIIFLLVLKMIAGVFYIYITKFHINGGDIFEFFKDGNIVYNQLNVNPINYLKLVFFPNAIALPSDESLKAVIFEMGFWEDIGSYMLVRFNALIRLISFGNIYVHGVFSGFLSFVGSFLILKVFAKQLKANKIVLFSIFLSPSLLFWTSGIHKEFISVFALGLILYNFFELIEGFNKPLNILFFVFGLFLFFLTRNYMLLALFPSLLSYFLYKTFHLRYNRAVFFSLIVFIGFLRFQKIPKFNKTGFELIVEKRNQFADLGQGNTSIQLDNIEANFVSLMKNSPKALFNTIARPHFGDIKNFFLALASIESLFISLLLIIAFLNFHKLNKKESNIVVFMLLYSFSLLLIIGWIVPNIGAIVRYRSIALLILIPALLFVVSKNKKFRSYF